MIDRRVIAADPDAARKRTEAARADRCVVREVGEDGMGVIKAILPAEGAVSVYELLDSIARATAGQDDRPVGARRADALIDICVSLLTDGRVDVTPMRAARPAGSGCAGASDEDVGQSRTKSTDSCVIQPENEPDAQTSRDSQDEQTPPKTDAGEMASEQPLPSSDPIADVAAAADLATRPVPTSPQRPALTRVMSHHGRSAHLNVTMSATTLAAMADHPATLAGHGVITADIARMIAGSIASLTVIAVDEQGHAVAVGATTYPPRQAVRDQVIAANPTCRFPACRQPAHLCELDHRDPFDHADPALGGLTDPVNLDPLCKNNHLLKTHTDWSAVPCADGVTLAWTSPTGHCYLDAPFEHAVPEQDHRIDDERFHNREGSGGPSGTDCGQQIGLADPEHIAACAEPSRTEPASSTIADVTRQFIRRQAAREGEDIARRRIEQIVQGFRSRHSRPHRAGARPRRQLFGKVVIEPVGAVEIRLLQLLSAAGPARPDVDSDQPPF